VINNNKGKNMKELFFSAFFVSSFDVNLFLVFVVVLVGFQYVISFG
jgi:hypothetical protein